MKTEAQYVKEVEADWTNIKKIRKANRTEAVCLAAVKKNPEALLFVPEEVRNASEALLTELIWADSRWTYGDVPEECWTERLALEALKAGGDYSHRVPKGILHTPEICREAAETGGTGWNVWGALCEEAKTPENCLALVKRHGYVLENIPREFLTHELCEAAVRSHPFAVRYVPEAFEDVYVLAVRQDERVFRESDVYKKNSAVLGELMKTNGSLIREVPVEMRTKELCMTAQGNFAYAYGYMPEEWRTDEVWRMAVALDCNVLSEVPEEMRTESMRDVALAALDKKEPERLKEFLSHVPYALRTEDVCRKVLKRNGINLRWVPKELMTHELCEIAVKSEGNAIGLVPQELCDETLNILAVENGCRLYNIPQSRRTEAVCKAAVAHNADNFDWIPEEAKTPEVCLTALKAGGSKVQGKIPAEILIAAMERYCAAA